MIRSVIALFSFAVVLCAYIVTRQPDAPNTASAIADIAAVSRAQSESLLAGTPAAPQASNGTALNLVPGTLDDSVALILQNLGIATDAPTPATFDQSFDLDAFALIVATALQAGTSDDVIDQTLNEAATADRFAVPASLIDTAGRIDTATLLSVVVSQAKTATGQEIAPDVLPARVTDQTYTVVEGDSLAAIAFASYGDASRHVDIWAANLDSLLSGYQLRAGQELFIP